jgi:hypothetical protein
MCAWPTAVIRCALAWAGWSSTPASAARACRHAGRVEGGLHGAQHPPVARLVRAQVRQQVAGGLEVAQQREDLRGELAEPRGDQPVRLGLAGTGLLAERGLHEGRQAEQQRVGGRLDVERERAVRGEHAGGGARPGQPHPPVARVQGLDRHPVRPVGEALAVPAHRVVEPPQVEHQLDRRGRSRAPGPRRAARWCPTPAPRCRRRRAADRRAVPRPTRAPGRPARARRRRRPARRPPKRRRAAGAAGDGCGPGPPAAGERAQWTN